MIGIVLIGHTPLPSAFARVAQHVYGDTPELVVCDIDSDASNDQQHAQIIEALSQLGTSDVLIMLDVFGATPANVLQQVLPCLTDIHCRIVCGCNIPMLLRVLAYRKSHGLDQLATIAIEGGNRGINELTDDL